MQQVNELITQQQAGSGQTSPESEHRRIERHKVQTLWGLMSSMFGHKWTSAFGDEVDPDRVWQACLSDVSPDQIRHGMNKLAKSGRDWPPAAPEFRAICLDLDGSDDTDWEQRRIEAANRENQARLRLERKRTPEEFAKGSAILKSLLSGAKNHG